MNAITGKFLVNIVLHILSYVAQVEVVIRPEEPKATVTVEEDKLPGGVTYDEPTNTISGTPDVTDWN